MKQCECGAIGALQITAADAEGYVLDTVVLCAGCANSREIQQALDGLGLELPEPAGGHKP